jgi:hypothetical protein
MLVHAGGSRRNQAYLVGRNQQLAADASSGSGNVEGERSLA